MEILIIETGRGNLGFTRFEKKGTGVVFAGADRRPAGDPDAFEAFLQEIRSDRDRNARVILSLDPGTLFSRAVELPFSDRRKQREVLPLELRGETALATEELVFDALPLGGGKAMAVWGVGKNLEEKLAAMTAAGLEPQVAGSSLYHWQTLLPDDGAEGCRALSDGRSLAVFRDGEPILFRSLGDGDFRQEIATTVALLEAGKGIRVDRVYLHGPAAGPTASRPSPDTTAPVTFADLPVTGALAASFAGESTAREYAGAWALATATLRGEPLNFRHGRFAYTAGRRVMQRKLRLTAILVGLFVLLLLAETGVRYYFVRNDLATLDSSILQIYREVFPKRTKPVDAVSELKAEIRRMGGGTSGPGVLKTLNMMSAAKGDGVLGIYDAEIEGTRVILKGDAVSYQAANNFRSSLSPGFESMEMDEVKSKPDGSVSFTFRGTLKEGGQ